MRREEAQVRLAKEKVKLAQMAGLDGMLYPGQSTSVFGPEVGGSSGSSSSGVAGGSGGGGRNSTRSLPEKIFVTCSPFR